jgi:hypothetical protein
VGLCTFEVFRRLSRCQFYSQHKPTCPSLSPNQHDVPSMCVKTLNSPLRVRETTRPARRFYHPSVPSTSYDFICALPRAHAPGESQKTSELVLHHKPSISWRGLSAYAPADNHIFLCLMSKFPFPLRHNSLTIFVAGLGHPICQIKREKFWVHYPVILARSSWRERRAYLWEGDPLHSFGKEPAQ